MTEKYNIGGQVHMASKYQIPYDALEKYINGLDPKAMKNMSAMDLVRKSFEFGYMYAALDKEDMQTRIDNLNAQNLKWFTKADKLEAECTELKKRLERNSEVKEMTLESLPSRENLSLASEQNSPASESSSKKQDQSEDLQISTAVTEEVTSSLK